MNEFPACRALGPRRRLALGLALVALSLGAKPLPVPFQSEYLAENWGLEDGFPENSCSGIVQAPDGYLWMGTFRGLVRFNGQEFKAWAPEAMPELKTASIINMHRDRKGRVWISTMDGLVLNEGATWKRWQENDGWGNRTDYARCYAESAQGEIVISTFSGRLLRYDDRGAFRELPAIPDKAAGGSWCAFDREGTLYTARQGNLWVWDEAERQWKGNALGASMRGGVLGLGQTRSGEALAVSADEVVRLRRGGAEQRLALTEPVTGYWQLVEDATGTLWLPALEAGVYRIRPDGQVKHFLRADGLPHSGGTRALHASEDGSLWIGSGVGGCARFRPTRFRVLGEAEGMGDRVILTLAPLRDGRVLLTTYGTGLAFFDGVKAVESVALGVMGKAYFRTVVRRRDDSIWLGTYGNGLHRLEESGELTPVKSEIFGETETINTLFEDSRGRLWVGGDRRVARMENGQFFEVNLGAGGPGLRSTTFAENRDGTVILARQNEVFAYGAAGLDPQPIVRLPEDCRVTTMLVDRDDRLWLGTAGHGLNVWQRGKLWRLSTDRGLPGSAIASLVQDDQGQLWFGAGRKVVRADPAELWKAGPVGGLQPPMQVFDQNDGLRELDFPDNTQPSVAKDGQGRIWFAMVRGAAMVDPAALKLEEALPRVVMESISYVPDGEKRPVEIALPRAAGPVVVPAGSRLIRIGYAALEFLAPRKQRFRVRLGGEKGEWQEMRNEVTVSFLELPAGRHTIQVQAAGSDGVWNRVGATLDFEVAAFYWQTGWFRGLIGVGLLSLVGGTVWLAAQRRVKTEREKLERERRLAEAQARLALVLENTSDLVQFADPAGQLIYVNRAGRTLVGLGAEADVRATPAATLLPAWAQEAFTREAMPAIERAGTWSGESALVDREGREIPVSLVVLAHRAPDGRLDFTSMIARDITVAKRHALVQDALRRLAAALNASLDAESLGRTVGEACRQIFAHDAFYLALLGERGEVEAGTYMEDTAEGEAEPRAVPVSFTALSPAVRQVQEGVPLLVNRDGSGNDPSLRDFLPRGITERRGASLMYAPVQWAGRVIGVVSVQSYRVQRYGQRDLEQLQTLADHCGAAIARMAAEASLRRNEEQLRQSQKLEAVGTLAGGIAHDFNNILTAILGNTELAAIDLTAERAVRDYLEQIRSSTLRARDLVRRILAFSRPQESQRRVIALPPVIEEVAQLLRATVSAAVEIETAVAGDVPFAEVDSLELHQVLLNLGTNAAHSFGSRPGRIEFSLEGYTVEAGVAKPHAELKPGRYARIGVRDNGKGIPAAILPRIFDPFFTTKAPGEGTGLGLSMAHGIMRAHGGAITVESAEDVGATFHLYFPAAAGRPAEAAAGSGKTPAANRPGRGERVLCVDDEPVLITVLQQVLTKAGFEVTGCTNPLEALAFFHANPGAIDLVVTDLSMPRMSGLELTRKLREVRPGLPVVLTSGYLRPGDLEEATQAGVREFVQKPSGLEGIVAVVARVLAERK